mgnify:CR=1 FL=1
MQIRLIYLEKCIVGHQYHFDIAKILIKINNDNLKNKECIFCLELLIDNKINYQCQYCSISFHDKCFKNYNIYFVWITYYITSTYR